MSNSFGEDVMEEEVCGLGWRRCLMGGEGRGGARFLGGERNLEGGRGIWG